MARVLGGVIPVTSLMLVIAIAIFSNSWTPRAIPTTLAAFKSVLADNGFRHDACLDRTFVWPVRLPLVHVGAGGNEAADARAEMKATLDAFAATLSACLKDCSYTIAYTFPPTSNAPLTMALDTNLRCTSTCRPG